MSATLKQVVTNYVNLSNPPAKLVIRVEDPLLEQEALRMGFSQIKDNFFQINLELARKVGAPLDFKTHWKNERAKFFPGF